MAVIASLNVLLKGDSSLFSQSMKKAGQDARSFESTIGGLSKKLGGFTTFLGGPVGIGISLIGTAAAATALKVINLTTAIADSSEQADLFAKRIGTTHDTLLALRLAADRNGSSAETMDAALQRMTNTIGEAGSGSASAQQTLMRLNLTFGILSQMQPGQQFLSIAKSISEIETPMERVAAVQDIFGKSAAEMGNLLNLTGGDIANYQKAIAQSGRSLTESQLNELSRLKDAVEDLGGAWEGLKVQATLAIAPGITGRIKETTGFIRLARENQSISGVQNTQVGLERRYAEEQAFRQSHININGQWVKRPDFLSPAEQIASLPAGPSNKFFGFDFIDKSAKSIVPSLDELATAVRKTAINISSASVVDSAMKAADNWRRIADGFAANAAAVYTEEKAKQDRIAQLLPGSVGVGSQEGFRLLAQRGQSQNTNQNPAVKAANKANSLLSSILSAVKVPAFVQFKL